MEQDAGYHFSLIDEDTLNLLARELADGLEPMLATAGMNSETSHFEMEVAFGKLKYWLPNITQTWTPNIDSTFPDCPTGITLAEAPFTFVIPNEQWIPNGEFERNIPIGSFKKISDALLTTIADDESSSVVAYTEWFVQHYVIPERSKEMQRSQAHLEQGQDDHLNHQKIRMNHNEHIPEKIVIRNGVSDNKDAIRLLKLSYYTSRIHDQSTDGWMFMTRSPSNANDGRDAFIGALSLVKSCKVIEDKLATIDSIKTTSPWVTDSTYAVRKTRLSQPKHLKSNFLQLFDLSFHISSEEQVSVMTHEKFMKHSSRQLGEILKCDKQSMDRPPRGRRPKVSAAQIAVEDSVQVASPPSKTIPIIITDVTTHDCVRLVVQCRRSIFFSSQSSPLVPLWRLDISASWRPLGGSHNQYLNEAHHWMDCFRRDTKYHPLASTSQHPSLEVELECVNPIGLLVDCEGDFRRMVHMLLVQSWSIQNCIVKHNFQNLSEMKISSGSFPTDMPPFVFTQCEM